MEMSELRKKFLETETQLNNLKNEKAALENAINSMGENAKTEDVKRHFELVMLIKNLEDELNDIRHSIIEEAMKNDEKNKAQSTSSENTYSAKGSDIVDNKLEVYRQIAKKETVKEVPKANVKVEEQPIEADYSENSKFKNWLKKNTDAILYTLIGALSVTAIGGIALLAHVSKKGNNNSNNSNNGTYEDTLLEAPSAQVEDMFAGYDQEIVNALTSKGYSEYAAKLMSINFDAYTIETLKNAPYTMAVENYATEAGFVYDYINDYENARTILNITPEKTVDYVNRSKVMAGYNLFPGSEFFDYVKVVYAIDNKEYHTIDNLEVSTLLANVTNEINMHLMDSLMLGTNQITAEDYNHLEALKYIAADGSDLDECITYYVDLNKKALEQPGAGVYADEGYAFLNIFVKSLNSFDNPDIRGALIPDSGEVSALTDNEALNNAAKVENATDWMMAWEGIVGPLSYSITPAVDGASEEYERFDEIFQTAESLDNMIRGNICGQSLTLESGE